MASNFQRFKSEVDQALALIENNKSIVPGNSIVEDISHSASLPQLVDTKSLLARCKRVCNKYERKKPTIRIFHHLACSGGKELSDYLGAMPNVYLLNEVHPFIKFGGEHGSLNLIDAVERASIPQAKELKASMFVENIKKIYAHVTKSGGHLVIRDNAYFDYLSSETINHKSISSLLETDFDVVSLLLHRDSIDAYASLKKANFYGNAELLFEEYCSRVCTFINAYPNAKLMRYEELISETNRAVKLACQHLDIGFNEAFELMPLPVDSPQIDNWRTTEIDRYNTKLDTVPSFEEVGNSESFFQLQKLTKPKDRKLILIATMPRSGSTWLFNCVRELYKGQGFDFYSSWAEDYEPSDQRKIHIVKVHDPEYRFSSQADIILSSRRDVRNICVSLIRMGWLENTHEAIVGQVKYLVELVHPFWNSRSCLEVEYQDIIEKPHTVISELATALKVKADLKDCEKIGSYLIGLKSPRKYDPETQLHPQHRSDIKANYKKTLTQVVTKEINDSFGNWLSKFEY